MQQENTARIHVPPTERIDHDAKTDAPTVIMAPDAGQQTAEIKGEKLFDQYTIYSKIGNGGMGVVYLARDRRLGRFVAIKRLNNQAQSIPSLRQRFLHEARAVATVRSFCPNLPYAFDSSHICDAVLNAMFKLARAQAALSLVFDTGRAQREEKAV